VLGYSRALHAVFTLDQTLESFLRGHVEAFTAMAGCARTLVYDYVPGHIVVVLRPRPICGGALLGRSQYEGAVQARAHNESQRREPLEEGVVIAPDGRSAG
jgi:hypothetical protein